MTEHRGRIVVGVDGSDESMAAVRWADGHARATDSDITIVSAWHWPIAAAPMGGIALAGLDPQRDARSFAEKAIAELSLPADRVEARVVEGPAGQALIKAARDADLLVVAARHGVVGGLLLGSVSTYCVHHAPVPVVVVR